MSALYDISVRRRNLKSVSDRSKRLQRRLEILMEDMGEIARQADELATDLLTELQESSGAAMLVDDALELREDRFKAVVGQ